MNTLIWTDSFVRTARRFFKKHPDLKGQFGNVLEKLESDIEHPALRLHALKGKLKGKHAVSLTYAYRIVLILVLEDDEIYLLDVGAHDDVYQKH